MIELTSIIAIAIASFFLAIVPGPTVSVIIANSLRAGSHAGLLNIAGTQLGLAVMILIIGFGLESILAFVSDWFYLIKLIGAAYLIWLGIKLIFSKETFSVDRNIKPPKIGYFWQGFVVVMANPKALLFYGAFIPQFVDPAGNVLLQSAVYGFVFMVVAGAVDAFYAIISGEAGNLLSSKSFKRLEIFSGAMLIGGGIWMATLNKS